MKSKEQMIDTVEQELYGKSAGYTSGITVAPGGSKDGLDYGPNVVEIVVLDHDGRTVAYRFSTDSQDTDWELGVIEDAVDLAIGVGEHDG
jgi:hypothetical protein